jgi:hypothetical protein
MTISFHFPSGTANRDVDLPRYRICQQVQRLKRQTHLRAQSSQDQSAMEFITFPCNRDPGSKARQIQRGASDDGLHQVSIVLGERVYAMKRRREDIFLVPERRNQLSCPFFPRFQICLGTFRSAKRS